MSWQDIELYAPCGERFKLGGLRHFYDEQPTGALISDIAQALGNIGRFGGRTRRFLSVAEHSINVAWRVQEMGGRPDQVLLALMHDCAEAFLGDIPTPMKPLMTLGGAAFADVETHVYGQIAEILGLPESDLETSQMIRKEDTDQRSHEEREVLGKPEFTLAYPHSFTESFLGAYEFWNNSRGKLSAPIMTADEVRERIESQEAGRG